MANTTQPAAASEETVAAPVGGATRGTSLWQKVVGGLGLFVVLWVGTELFDVVTSGGERPRGGTPPAVDQAPTSGDQAPPAGAHDPSQFNH